MANIRKLYEADQTTQLMPQTHEKAVIDNNGTTAETKFQVITDLVNQAQMEVGAVPSDLTPIPNSTNWVTSDGVFRYKLAEYGEIPSNTWITGTIRGTIGGSAPLHYYYYQSWDLPKFVPVIGGSLVKITASSQGKCRAAFVKNTNMGTQPSQTGTAAGEVPFGTGETAPHDILANGEGYFYVPADANYIYFPQKVSESWAFPSSVVIMVDAKGTAALVRNEYTKADNEIDAKKQDKYFYHDLSNALVIPSWDEANLSAYTYRVTLRQEPCLKDDVIEWVSSSDYPNQKVGFLILCYNKNKTKIYQSGWITSYTITEDGYYTVVVSLNTNSGTADPDMLYASIRHKTTIGNVVKEYYDAKPKKDLDDMVYRRMLLNNATNIKTFEGVSPMKNQFRCTKLANFGQGCQSLAIYKDYVFWFSKGGKFKVFEFGTFRSLATVNATFPTNQVHFNSAWFSDEFYDVDDQFPILYSEAIDTSPYIRGYRIQCIDKVWSITQVHTIARENDNMNLVLFDKQNDQLIYVSDRTQMIRYQRPTFANSDNGASILTDNDIISTVSRSGGHGFDFGQDKSIYGNIAVSISYSVAPLHTIFGVDLTTGEETFTSRMLGTTEGEGVEWYNGRLYILDNPGNLYEIVFL